jgi:hypothetical protein
MMVVISCFRGSMFAVFYIWVAYDHQAGSVIHRCFPFLCTKKRHAEVALAFVSARSLVTGKGHSKQLSPSLELKWEQFFRTLRAINGRKPIYG